MKIKEVCRETGLTDRAVRFYIEEGLITPAGYERNGRTYYEYYDKDIEQLKAIATLRKAGFSIEEIRQMQQAPEKIDVVLEEYYSGTERKLLELQNVVARMEQMKRQGCSFANICELAVAFREDSMFRSCEKLYNAVEITPDFGRLDNETEEEKVRMYEEFLGHRYVQDKREAKIDRLKAFLPIRVLFWIFNKIKNFIPTIVIFILFLFLIMLINVMIPRNMSKLFRDVDDSSAYWYYQTTWYEPETNDFEHHSGSVTADTTAYKEIENIIAQYSYHGFVGTLFPRDSINWGGQKVLFLAIGDENGMGNEIWITEEGEFKIRKGIKWYTYRTDWIGQEKAKQLYQELEKMLQLQDS